MKALIKVGYDCNENCTFCHTLETRHVQGSSEEIHRKIDRAHALGHSMVVFSGGEATIRPELVEWFDHAVELGLDTGLVTNGLMLSYDKLLEQLMERRLGYVYMSMHGATEGVHDRIARTKTFEPAVKAIEGLAGRGLDFMLNCVVVRQNLDGLRDLVDLVAPLEGVDLKFSAVQAKGGGTKLFKQLTPRITEIADRVEDAIRYGWSLTGGPNMRFRHDGVPFCLIPGLEHLFDDLKTHQYATMVEVGETDFFPVDDLNKVQPPKCEPCSIRGACPGLYLGYHETFGADELVPVTGRERSNSFDYVFDRIVTTDAAEDTCPLKDDGITPWDKGRDLFVRNGPKVGLYRSTSRDFADVEIDATKHGDGQVYLDVSRKPAPDDFAKDLVKLGRSALCIDCALRKDCTGLYEPVFEDVFTADDAKVRAIVSSLEGDVLDVGCGDGPYAELLAPRARAGIVRYTGIDPDEARIASLSRRWPWAKLEATTAEAHAATGRAYDHVLVLRSWNHLIDPGGTMSVLVGAMRPGGTLTVVDNVAFGLARMPRQHRVAAESDSRFEHFRNDGATEAARVLDGLGLDLEDRSDITPQSSNQWVLKYRIPLP